MSRPTKIFLAVFAVMMGIVVAYYGVLSPEAAPGAATAGTAIVDPTINPQPQPAKASPQPIVPAIRTELPRMRAASPQTGFLSQSIQAARSGDMPAGGSNQTTVEPAATDVRPPFHFPTMTVNSDVVPTSATTSAQPSVTDLSRIIPGESTPLAAVTASPLRTRPPSLSQPTMTDYVVKPGDTMSTIAEAWFDSAGKWTFIAKANPLVDPMRMQIGQKLRLPPKDAVSVPEPTVTETKTNVRTYTVKPGDTLASIARNIYNEFGKWKSIYEANQKVIGPNPSRLAPGMKLALPDAPSDRPAR